jgi:hypothetical protein
LLQQRHPAGYFVNAAGQEFEYGLDLFRDHASKVHTLAHSHPEI